MEWSLLRTSALPERRIYRLGVLCESSNTHSIDEEKMRRRMLARLLVPEVYVDRELHIAVLNAIYSDIATKEDIGRLEERLDKRMARIEERIDNVVNKVGYRSASHHVGYTSCGTHSLYCLYSTPIPRNFMSFSILAAPGCAACRL